MPGELITKKTLDTLQTILDLGGVITGVDDPSLEKIRIIDLD